MRPDLSAIPPQTRETIREWDRRAIEEYGIPGVVLMENAGSGSARILLDLLDSGEIHAPVWIVCGPGNNGGDGLVVARHLDNAYVPVEVAFVRDPSFDSGSDSAIQYAIARRMGISMAPWEARLAEGRAGEGTLVDALFGTGLSRPLEPPYSDCVETIRASALPVIALDTPSGLDANEGTVLGTAVRARHTITFAAPKVGFGRASGPSHCGTVHVVDIGIPRAIRGA